MKLHEKFSVPHICKEEARYHVTSYCGHMAKHYPFHIVALDWCSEPFCELNAGVVKTCVESGIDPAAVAPSSALANWLQSPAGRAALQEGKE